LPQIQTRDQHAFDRRLDVAAVRILRIARQHATDLDRIRAAREDRHAVVALLTVPDHAVTGVANRALRKFFLRRFQFLKAHDIRRGLAQPPQHVG
jgi:hypothetical protein